MRILLGMDNISDLAYKILLEDLSNYQPVGVTRSNDEITVCAEGDVIKCSCIVAICDKFRKTDQNGD